MFSLRIDVLNDFLLVARTPGKRFANLHPVVRGGWNVVDGVKSHSIRLISRQVRIQKHESPTEHFWCIFDPKSVRHALNRHEVLRSTERFNHLRRPANRCDHIRRAADAKVRHAHARDTTIAVAERGEKILAGVRHIADHGFVAIVANDNALSTAPTRRQLCALHQHHRHAAQRCAETGDAVLVDRVAVLRPRQNEVEPLLQAQRTNSLHLGNFVVLREHVQRVGDVVDMDARITRIRMKRRKHDIALSR